MKQNSNISSATLFLFLLLPSIALQFIAISATQACTIFRMKAKDGTITLARSMEFGVNLSYDLIVVPRNKPFFSPSPVSKLGLKWTTLNGYVGVASMGMDFGVSDGMNEKGLSVSVLWYESDMLYQTVAPADSGKALAQVMFADWALGNFSTVDEVRSALSKVKVFFYSDPSKMKMPVTVHFIVYDANGGCIVVEYDKGQCNIYDNPLGIMTNAPSLPWQYTNLRQYIGLENVNPIPVKVGGFTFNPTGHGDGMLGIPGDYTPPSRFIRLAMFENFVTRQPDAASNLNLCQHIINTFSIPLGIIVDKDASGNIVSNESTQWVTFRDLTNRQFYFKTYENPTLRVIDLKRLDFSAKEVRRIQMYGSIQTIIDITNKK
ncbi:MAG: choloylglycine hydrolase family protein [Bacteroidota bacterium]